MLIVERLCILFKPYFGSFLYYDVIRHVTDPQKVFESILKTIFTKPGASDAIIHNRPKRND